MIDKKRTSAELRAFIAGWPHDPRRSTRGQPIDEQLGQPMQAFSDHPETFVETVERIGKATAEDVDEMPASIGVDWGSGEPATVYGAMRDGKVVYCTPDREEFSSWLEKDGLREER